MMKNKLKQKGFTLIELLVVISIIGLLAAIGLVTFYKVRMDARDARRNMDLETISKALELYYHDNGKYPAVPSSGNYPNFTQLEDRDASWADLETILRPYLVRLPRPTDVGPGSNIFFKYATSGNTDVCVTGWGIDSSVEVLIPQGQQGFALIAHLENLDSKLGINQGLFLGRYIIDRWGGNYSVTPC